MPIYVGTKTICDRFEISKHTLYRHVEAGNFKLSRHYILVNGPRALRPAYRWNAEAIEAWWATHPARRHSK